MYFYWWNPTSKVQKFAMGGQLCRYRTITKLYITVQNIQICFRLIVAEMSDMRCELSRRKIEIHTICRQIFGSLIAIVDNKLLNQWSDLVGKIHNYVAERCRHLFKNIRTFYPTYSKYADIFIFIQRYLQSIP